MANLIITVISIALVAVAALMGAYYGGSAFLEGQKKAEANTLVAQAEQIATAWTMQASSNGGDWVGQGDLSTLVPNYLSALPKPPGMTGMFRRSSESEILFTYGGYGGSGSTEIDRIVLDLPSGAKGAELCNAIAQIAQGPSGAPDKVTDYDFGAGISGKFNCSYAPLNDGGPLDGGQSFADADDGGFWFIYKVR